MSDVCRHGKTLNETCTACIPDDKAPELIEVENLRGGTEHRVAKSLGVATTTSMPEEWFRVKYRRADLAWLPDDLVERLKERIAYDGDCDGRPGPGHEMLREILKAVAR